jgi:excinuclease ABC subunit C
MLRDDKNFPYLTIKNTHEYPKIDFSRKVVRDGSRYYGPFVTGSLRELLRFVNKVFRLRDCSDSEFANRSRPCLNYDMAICTAPCVSVERGGLEVDEYREQIEEAELFLLGKTKDLTKRLKSDMMKASENLEFEKAESIKDRIESIERFQENQKMLDANSDHDWDVVGFAKNETGSYVTLLYIRGGKLSGRKNWTFTDTQGDDTEVLSQFIFQYYETNRIPPIVLLPLKLKDTEALEQGIYKKSDVKVKFQTPKVGKKFDFIKLANQNASIGLEQLSLEKVSGEGRLLELQKKLKLKKLPERMECFDISHFQGTETVASKVAFYKGEPNKSFYRKYIIRSVGNKPDDFQSMKEVLSRRFKEKNLVDDPMPDFVLVDGGQGQLSMAVEALKELGIEDLEIGAIAKARTESDATSKEVQRSDERIFLPGRKNAVNMREGQPATNLVQRIRDEAHRFAITFHRKRRDKKSLTE